jgi:hypothetical protein
VIDDQVSKLSAKFVFKNPNETDACGCGGERDDPAGGAGTLSRTIGD